jgi:hypothetical protein
MLSKVFNSETFYSNTTSTQIKDDPTPQPSIFRKRPIQNALTISKPIFLPPAYSSALIYFGQERGFWITCNYPTVLKEKNRNRKSTTSTICWLKCILH